MTGIGARASGLLLTVTLPFAAVAMADPNVEGRYPTCPVRLLLGVDCPGCGSLRALHDLVHGNLLAAIDHNAVLVLAVLPLVVVEGSRWVVGRTPSRLVRWRYAGVTAVVALASWTLLRNIHIFPFDLLAASA